jgi:hypothetical protein
MAEEVKSLDDKQLVARRKQIDDKRVELRKLEDETPKFYLGRPVTVIAETHPSQEWTIRFDDTGETESVKKSQVTDSPEPLVPAMGPAEARMAAQARVANERAEKTAKENKNKPSTNPDQPAAKDWFKK